MRMKSTMSHSFSQAPQVDVPRSSFNRSHGIKTTFNSGYLIPFFVDEVLPGDTHKLNATLFARFATLLYPLMDNMFIDVHYWFVPNRLVYENWQQLCGERKPNPDSSIDYEVPTVTSASTTDFDQGSIYDYMGVPTKISGLEISSLPLRAYNLIYNEWYRSESLQNSVTVSTSSAADSPSDFTLLRRGKRYDYFTSCLPWPQRGTAVKLPLTGNADVVTNGLNPLLSNGAGITDGLWRSAAAPTTNPIMELTGTTTGVGNLVFGSETGLQADLSSVTAATINDLREAFQVQRFQEREARGGDRYVEILKSFFGVTSPDQRLQRPEFLHGSSTPLIVTPVANTSATATENQGELSAYGTATETSSGFIHSFVEHGHIIGILSARADLSYQQGLNRMWSRRNRLNFYWPVFAHLGEQPVLQKEIEALGTSADDNVFGYQEAWADYRYKNSTISGLFRSNATGSLDAWHLAQDLSTPALNSTFIQDNPPTSRVKANTSDPDFILDGYIQLHSVRPMPTYSVPGLIDHF
jgi:hypothetical protein